MKTKITKIVSTVVLLATVGTLIFTSSKIEPDINLNDEYVPGMIEQPKPSEPVTEPIVTEPGYEKPEFVFNTYIPREWNSEDYSDSEEDVVYIPESTKFCTSYDFSNGFAVDNTDNLRTGSLYKDYVTFWSLNDDDLSIEIYEINPIGNTIQELKNTSLSEHDLSYYLNCEPLGIPMDTSEESLLRDYADYFGYAYLDTNPTESGMWRLLTDDIIKTAFGNALYIEYKNLSNNAYTAEAYILCDRDRILCIKIVSSSREYFYEYLVELTNEGITIIK